jgi:hypothetical protein
MDWLSAAIAAAAALGGVFLQAHLDRGRREREGRERGDAEKLSRIRDHELRRIDQTRSSLVGQLDFAWSIAQGDKSRALHLKDTVDQHLRTDPRLMGDLELVRAWGALVLRLLEKFPRGRLEKAVWPILRRGTDYDDVEAVSSVRARLLDAFDAQERRALVDEPLVTVTPESAATIVELERINERLRELLG